MKYWCTVPLRARPVRGNTLGQVCGRRGTDNKHIGWNMQEARMFALVNFMCMDSIHYLFYSPFFRADVDYCPNCKKKGKGYTVRLSELQIHTTSIPCTADTSDRLKWTKQRKGLLWKGCDNVMIFLSSPQLPLSLALVPSPSLMLFSHCVTAAWWLTHCRDATSEWYARWVIHQSVLSLFF